MNDLEKVIALTRAAPVVRMMRDGGTTWEDIAYKQKKTANPLGLSPRQLARIYEGPGAYRFDNLRRLAKRL